MSSADIPIRGGGRREGGGGQRGRGGRGGGGGQRGRGGRGGGGQRGRGRGRGEYTPSPSSYRPRSYSSSAASSAASSAPPASSSLYRDSSVAAAAVSLGRLSVQEQAAAAQTSEPTVHAITARRPTYDEASFPIRPGFGKEGDKCWVRANHYLVSLTKEISVYHYDVSISPEVITARVNRAVINQLVNLYGKSYLGDKLPGYDGKKSLYTAGSLPFESKEFVIKLGDDGKKRIAQRREREFKVVIKFANRVDLHHLNKFLSGVQMDLPQEVLQALDVVMRESRSIKYVTVGRSFFAPEFGEKSSLGDGLECWKGFHQSIRPTQMGLSLNIDVSATSFYEPIPVIEYVTKLLNVRDQSRPLSDSDRVKVKKVLRGVKVVDTHRKNSCGQYRVSGITSVPTSQLMFPDECGHTVSVVQYFWKKYRIRLQYVAWPSLQAGTDKRPIYLPMEVCTIVEGQRYSKKLNENQVTAILKASCQRPHDRERNVKEIVDYNNYSEDDFAKAFGIEVKTELASIGARVLQPPVLKYHPSSLEDHCRPQVGQWNMINKKVFDGGKVENWTCLNLSRTNQNGVVSFCRQLVDFCRDIGMDFATDSLIPIRSCHPNQIDDVLRDISSQCTAKLENMQVEHKHLQLLIVILPEGRDTYGRIKRICETELGIVTQCCKPRHVLRPNRQYLGNLALKINVKVGGRNTVLCDAITRRISHVTDFPTIIFGADVTHPQPGEDSSPSIAAVVASMDWPEITKYRGLVSSQPHRRELIDDLFIEGGAKYQGMIRDHLMAFYRSTQQKPHHIIFFRDGVSEGQFSQVLLHEIEAIRKACKSLHVDYLPPVTFVVVQKRHHTRFFPTNSNFTDRSGNIKPGTVIDTMICHPTEFDFYLCSHAGIQGTSRPTHYHVLFDENNFTADEMQKLTYNLCYTYARCTHSVSVVPPAYYAHLAAFRARYYLDDASDNGSTIGGGINRELNAAVRPLPELKDVVKDVMFYC